MKSLENKTVWITGASDGIGRELAIQMAREGAKIIMTARNVEKLNVAKDQLSGDQHWIVPMDLLQVNEIDTKAAEVLSQIGRLDILINNAGISQRSLAQDTKLEVDRKIMELDHFAVVALTKAILPHMKAQKSGHIITISSVAGKMGVPYRTAYCAAKHAVFGFMDALRAELYNDGIKVMVVAPGSVKTNISINALEGDGSKHNVTDPLIANGMPVEECARKIIKGIKNNTPELVVASGKTALAVKLRRFYPGLLFTMMAKMKTT